VEGIGRRSWPDGHRRQEDFTPLETLICFGLGLVGSKSASGNINISETSLDAQMFAALFKRSVKSLAAKLANLDGRRTNGAKHEQELWIRLTSDRDRFVELYASILNGGRTIGLDARLLPDFLGHDNNILRLVNAADSVSDGELLLSLDAQLAARDEERGGLDRLTERAMLGTARVGQRQFARKVLTNGGFACAFCGLSPSAGNLPTSRILIASHIKPWSQSNNHERVDFRNGLTACPTHDAAFEAHFFSIDGNGAIVRSHALEAAIAHDHSWAHNFGDLGLASVLVMPSRSVMPAVQYTNWHRSISVRGLPSNLSSLGSDI
jgi:putative restriction endonuclease